MKISKGARSLPELLDIVRDAALDKKAEDLLVLPLEGRTIVADAFVIATGRSKIQTRSIADAVTEAARDGGFYVARTEGYSDAGWILIDLGPVVVHVFSAPFTISSACGVLRKRVRHARREASHAPRALAAGEPQEGRYLGLPPNFRRERRRRRGSNRFTLTRPGGNNRCACG